MYYTQTREGSGTKHGYKDTSTHRADFVVRSCKCGAQFSGSPADTKRERKAHIDAEATKTWNELEI